MAVAQHYHICSAILTYVLLQALTPAESQQSAVNYTAPQYCSPTSQGADYKAFCRQMWTSGRGWTLASSARYQVSCKCCCLESGLKLNNQRHLHCTQAYQFLTQNPCNQQCTSLSVNSAGMCFSARPSMKLHTALMLTQETAVQGVALICLLGALGQL